MTPTESFLWDAYHAPVLDSEQMAECLGYKSAGSLLNAISAETLGFKTFRRGRGRYVLLTDVAAYLDSLRGKQAA